MTTVPQIFQDAVRTTSNHRKNIVVLRKLHLRKGHQLDDDFRRCILRILPVKKGNVEAERAIKFLTAYLEAFTSGTNGQVPEDAIQMLDGLIVKLLTFLRKGFRAKDKVVRYRVCQVVGVLLNHMDEVDDETFLSMRDQLLERTRDKESTVRVQAASALSRLQDGGDEEDDAIIRECLINLLQYDTSADVRKAVLWNISVNSVTLPYILQRARDIDPQVRKLAFLKVGEDVEKMTFLTIEERHLLLQNGLSDRDSNVQKSALKMLCERWVSQCEDSLLNFLRRMDVITGEAAESAAKAYLLANPSLSVAYDEATWDNLDVEESFFLRMAITFYAENQMDEELEEALPPLVRHAELLQKYGLLMSEAEEAEEKLVFGFILKQLLLIAQVQDFGDEMGRRDMLVGLRDMLSSIDLSKENILIAVRIVKKLSLNESDFTRIIIEVLYTIYDVDMVEPLQSQQTDAGGEASEEMQMDEIERSLLMLKCLDLISCVLEITEENLRVNASMNGILNSFILPALKNDHPAIQHAGLHCLALACLLDKALAQSQLPLFMSAFSDSRQQLSLLALKVFFDLTILFGSDLLSDQGLLTEIISETLQCDEEELLTLAVEGAAKLMMLSYLADPTVLQQIVILYFHPHTKDMNRLRQCLSYFLPVFAHASHRNQQLLVPIVVPSLQILMQEYVVSKEAMIQPIQIGQQLIDWTDVRKAVRFGHDDSEVDEGLHGDLAIELLEAAADEEDQGTQKIYCQMLNRLQIGTFVGVQRLCQIADLVHHLLEALSRNSTLIAGVKKFARSIAEINEGTLERRDEEEFLEYQKLIVALGELRIGLGTATPGTREKEEEDVDADI